MDPLDFNLLYIKSQFAGDMNALNTHSYSFPRFKKKEQGAQDELSHK